MRVRYNSLARVDVVEILEYYECEAGHETAVDFFSELRHGIRQIATRANSFPEIRKGIRRYLLKRFPYQIDYEIVDAETVKLLVIKHQSRHPDFGLDR